MVTCEEKFKLLQYLDVSLNWTNPTESLAKAIGFDKRFHRDVGVYIMANGNFLFDLSLPYEYPEYKELSYEEIVWLIDYARSDDE